MINTFKMKRKITDFQNLADGISYFIREEGKYKIRERRFERFGDWMKDNDFDTTFYMLILKHDDVYRNKCYNNGYEPTPNNVLMFILDYVEMKCSPVVVNELECEFNNITWEFNKYYFQLIYGQGIITRIYNVDDLKLILQI